MLANAEVKWAVLKAVDVFFDHIANGRLHESVACFTDDADITLIGSEAGELAVGAARIRALLADVYARPYRVLFRFSDRRVSAHGNVAWFTGEGTFRLSTGDEERPYRLSAVLERRGDRWLWQLFSGSEPHEAWPA